MEPVKDEVYPIAAPDLNAYVANLRKAGLDGVIGWIASVPERGDGLQCHEDPEMVSRRWPVIAACSSTPCLTSCRQKRSNMFAARVPQADLDRHEQPGKRQNAFAKKLSRDSIRRPRALACPLPPPVLRFSPVLKTAIEGEKSFEPEKIKKALDNLRGYKGLLGDINFTPENHSASA